jgi:hypothetical protein
MLALAMIAAIRHQANKRSPKEKSGSESVPTDPLVSPGNPPHRNQARPKTHQTCPYRRMVALAKSPSSRIPTRAYQIQNAIAMLVDFWAFKRRVNQKDNQSQNHDSDTDHDIYGMWAHFILLFRTSYSFTCPTSRRASAINVEP